MSALDFGAVTAAVDASTIVTAIGAIAAIKILPGVARWGFETVIFWFDGSESLFISRIQDFYTDTDPYGDDNA